MHRSIVECAVNVKILTIVCSECKDRYTLLYSVCARNFKNGVKWDSGTQLYINIEKKKQKNSRPSQNICVNTQEICVIANPELC